MNHPYWVNCPQCGWRKMPKHAYVCLTCQERIAEYNRRMKGVRNKHWKHVEIAIADS